MNNLNKQIQEAIKVLTEGGIVIFPTDTAFGIGCRIDDKKAVERLFRIRKRPKTQSVSVLVDTVKMAQDYLLPIPKEVIIKLMETFWPGALTIVLPCKINKIPTLVRGGGQTLGVRIPNHSLARALIQGVGVPVLGPSANFHGGKTPYKFEDLDQRLVKLVDYVVPGECSICKESTIIDCSKKPWKILREGAIKIQNSRLHLPSAKADGGQAKFKNKTILIIDTSNSKEITAGLGIDSQKYVFKQKVGLQKAQAVLPMIEKILKKHQLKLEDLEEIKVNIGPGSFTGIRVGVAIANALSFALKVPVNGKKVGEFVEPVY